MSKSTYQFEIKGVDKSAGAFSSIKKSAAATSAQIRSMVGGAIAAAGAYVGLRALSSSVDELGHLSDIAQKTSTSVDELTKAATAFNVLGIQGMGVDQIGKAFDYMAKSTGRQGMEGFYKTIEELAKIPDVATRGQEAMKVFGRSGMEFMPLIKGAEDGTSAIRNVIDTMPGVAQAAANAGDDLADAKTIGAAGFKSIWLNAIGAVCARFGFDFRGGAAAMVAYVDYGARMAWRYLSSFFQSNDKGIAHFSQAWEALKTSILRNVVILTVTATEYLKTIPNRFIAGVTGGLMSIPAMFSSSFRKQYHEVMGDWMGEISHGMWSAIDKELKSLGVDIHDTLGGALKDVFSDVKTDDLEMKLKSALDKAHKLRGNVSAAVGEGGKIGVNGLNVQDQARKVQIRNDLVLGGSNAALKLSLLGPNLQTETKKQTEILQRIDDKLGNVESNQKNKTLDDLHLLD